MKALQHTGKFKWAGGPHGKPVAGVLLNKIATSAIATTPMQSVSYNWRWFCPAWEKQRRSRQKSVRAIVRGDNHLLLEIVGIRVDHREKR